MPTELRWPRRSTFVESAQTGVDDEEHRYEGPGTYVVPDAMVEAYLNRGWERPDEADKDPEAASQEADDDADSGGESEAEAQDFDAGAFVAESWQAVKAGIEAGEADGHLDAVEAAERDRDNDPRTSVIDAIDSRR